MVETEIKIETKTETKLVRLKTKSYDWAEKYRPQTLSEVIGHPTAIEELRLWAENWKIEVPKTIKNRAIILYGPPGTGKTSTVYALAHDIGWEVVELNASDQRTAKVIEKIVGSASQMKTLSGIIGGEKGGVGEGMKYRKRLILVDEADNIHGTSDRGGEKALITAIRSTNQPIILTANELYDMGITLRGMCRNIHFKAVMSRSIVGVLRGIVVKENVVYGAGVLEKIAENADGDIRSAINDLQAISQGKSKIELDDIIMGERDTKENIFKVLGKIFRGNNIKDAQESTFGLDEDPEGFIQWVDENLPLMYKGKDLEEGYRYLERASLFLGRVRRRQDYSMWKYANLLMTAGIIVARNVGGGGGYGGGGSGGYSGYGYPKFQAPSIRRRLGQTKSMRTIRDSVALKIGRRCHVSKSFVRSQLFTFFRMMIRDDRYNISVAALLGLDENEILFLLGGAEGGDIGNVKKIYEGAQSNLEKERIHEIEIFGGFGEGLGFRKRKENVEDIGEISEDIGEMSEDGEDREIDGEDRENDNIYKEYIDEENEEDEKGVSKEIKEKEIKKGIEKIDKDKKVDKDEKDKNQRSLFDF